MIPVMETKKFLPFFTTVSVSFILNRIQYNSAGHTKEQKQFDHDIKNLAKYCLLVRLQLSNSESRNKPLEYLA